MDSEKFVHKVFRELGYDSSLDRRIGEPVGRVKFGNRVFFFRGGNLPINNAASADLSRDKYATCYFLEKAGYKVPDFSFIDRKWEIHKRKDTINKFLNKFKLIHIKPNFGYEGNDVYMVDTKKNKLNLLIDKLSDTDIILQKTIIGNDYRIVILKGKIILAYLRSPLTITADGKSNVGLLIRKERGMSGIKLNSDLRIINCLTNQGLNYRKVLKLGTNFRVYDSTNLSNGGLAQEMEVRKIHKQLQQEFIGIARSLDLNFCAIDIIARDIYSSKSYYCLEVNSAPEFYKFARKSKSNYAKVLEIYKSVLMQI